MPDNFVLYSPQGSPINLASVLRADPGPDFGRLDLPHPVYAANPLAEGAALAYETAGLRRFAFPLRLASGMLGLPLDRLDATLTTAARPGAWIDLQPENVPSNAAVRFDIVDGRMTAQAWQVYLQRIARREVTVELDVMPYGYWPTWITLASVASVALPGRLSIPAGSIIGDAPGLARLTVQPSTATAYPAGSWLTDMLAWGLGGYASLNTFIGGAQMVAQIARASTVTDAKAPGGARLDFYPSQFLGAWRQLAVFDVPTALEPSWRGRFRTFAYARMGEPTGLPWQLTVDAVGGLQTNRAMGSANAIGTIPWDAATWAVSGSPGFELLDLGELTLPLTASGVPQSTRLRVWGYPGTTNAGVASPLISLAGIQLLPLDGGAGVLPRGLAQPSILTPSVGRFVLDADARTAVVAGVSNDLSAAPAPMGDGYAYYQGDLPRILPSTVALDLIGGMRSTASGATAPLVYTAPAFAAVSITYQPRFQFLKGL